MALSSNGYGDYLKLLGRGGEPVGYSEFVRDALKKIEKNYNTALADAKLTGISQSASYGSRAESLGSSGLLGGGYAEYLSEAAKSAERSAISAAADTRDKDTATARSGYRDYLKKFTEGQQKLYSKVVSDMTASDMRDFGDLIEYASGAGLSAEYALSAANAAEAAITEKLKKSVINAINSEGYTERESYDYAIALGLPMDIAKQLSEYAKKIHDEKINDDYLSGIKNKN